MTNSQQCQARRGYLKLFESVIYLHNYLRNSSFLPVVSQVLIGNIMMSANAGRQLFNFYSPCIPQLVIILIKKKKNYIPARYWPCIYFATSVRFFVFSKTASCRSAPVPFSSILCTWAMRWRLPRWSRTGSRKSSSS